MPIPVEKLTEEMLALSADARALLADRLVESLDPLADEEVGASWAAEAVRRRDEVRSGKVEAIPGEVAAAQVRALLHK
jgi:putative addiction module component (TIGR02574 family)